MYRDPIGCLPVHFLLFCHKVYGLFVRLKLIKLIPTFFLGSGGRVMWLLLSSTNFAVLFTQCLKKKEKNWLPVCSAETGSGTCVCALMIEITVCDTHFMFTALVHLPHSRELTQWVWVDYCSVYLEHFYRSLLLHIASKLGWGVQLATESCCF